MKVLFTTRSEFVSFSYRLRGYICSHYIVYLLSEYLFIYKIKFEWIYKAIAQPEKRWALGQASLDGDLRFNQNFPFFSKLLPELADHLWVQVRRCWIASNRQSFGSYYVFRSSVFRLTKCLEIQVHHWCLQLHLPQGHRNRPVGFLLQIHEDFRLPWALLLLLQCFSR